MKCPYNDFKDCFKDECPFYSYVKFGDISAESCKRAAQELNNSLPYVSNSLANIPETCRYCPNHPSNGGSGICHCILGQKTWT